ncbi:epimerase [Roseibacterium sp. SDUM158016]|uniref:epimerase n=1 Tax=Roseicyclus sediminis TaxID=2980997 RepID=UPI0021CFBA8D|nr:epimerase [Roseibacterium sp. SDUM158016]MCU4651638.1 epimerase [Roseibacterium sp. SDUM158016]
MSRKALILGASGRFGRAAAHALEATGWQVQRFDRQRDKLPTAAHGAALIVNAWNPPYSRWAAEVPGLTAAVIAAARDSGAAVAIPGNVYVYGEDLPPVLSPDTPHGATHPLGRIRRELEDAYRAAGVRTFVLRAGDFLDTEASGNWFDRVLAAGIDRGRFTYPGSPDIAHAWAFLPDLAQALAGIAARLDDLPTFSEFTFEGHTATGRQLAEGIARVTDRPIRLKRMSWLPIQLARPFWPEAKQILEMRYLWDRPHSIDGSALAALIGPPPHRPLDDALRAAVQPLLQKSRSTQTSR